MSAPHRCPSGDNGGHCAGSALSSCAADAASSARDLPRRVPFEIAYLIMQHLPPRDIYTLLTVSRSFLHAGVELLYAEPFAAHALPDRVERFLHSVLYGTTPKGRVRILTIPFSCVEFALAGPSQGHRGLLDDSFGTGSGDAISLLPVGASPVTLGYTRLAESRFPARATESTAESSRGASTMAARPSGNRDYTLTELRALFDSISATPGGELISNAPVIVRPMPQQFDSPSPGTWLDAPSQLSSLQLGITGHSIVASPAPEEAQESGLAQEDGNAMDDSEVLDAGDLHADALDNEDQLGIGVQPNTAVNINNGPAPDDIDDNEAPISPHMQLTQRSFAIVRILTKLYRRDIRYFAPAMGALMSFVLDLPALEELDLNTLDEMLSKAIAQRAAKHLKQPAKPIIPAWPRLRRLWLWHDTPAFVLEHRAHLLAPGTLRELKLQFANLSDDDVRALVDTQRGLRVFGLLACSAVTGGALIAVLSRCSDLRRLEYADCPEINMDQVLDYFAANPDKLAAKRLAYLRVARPTLSRGLATLSSLTQIEFQYLNSDFDVEDNVSRPHIASAVFDSLAQLPFLRALSFEGTHAAQIPLADLLALPHLEALDVSTGVFTLTSDDMASAQPLHHHQQLGQGHSSQRHTVNHENAADSSLQSKLRVLYMDDTTNVTAPLFKIISVRCPYLQELDLMHVRACFSLAPSIADCVRRLTRLRALALQLYWDQHELIDAISAIASGLEMLRIDFFTPNVAIGSGESRRDSRSSGSAIDGDTSDGDASPDGPMQQLSMVTHSTTPQSIASATIDAHLENESGSDSGVGESIVSYSSAPTFAETYAANRERTTITPQPAEARRSSTFMPLQRQPEKVRTSSTRTWRNSFEEMRERFGPTAVALTSLFRRLGHKCKSLSLATNVAGNIRPLINTTTPDDPVLGMDEEVRPDLWAMYRTIRSERQQRRTENRLDTLNKNDNNDTVPTSFTHQAKTIAEERRDPDLGIPTSFSSLLTLVAACCPNIECLEIVLDSYETPNAVYIASVLDTCHALQRLAVHEWYHGQLDVSEGMTAAQQRKFRALARGTYETSYFKYFHPPVRVDRLQTLGNFYR